MRSVVGGRWEGGVLWAVQSIASSCGGGQGWAWLGGGGVVLVGGTVDIILEPPPRALDRRRHLTPHCRRRDGAAERALATIVGHDLEDRAVVVGRQLSES